jgi:hypothetical protein
VLCLQDLRGALTSEGEGPRSSRDSGVWPPAGEEGGSLVHQRKHQLTQPPQVLVVALQQEQEQQGQHKHGEDGGQLLRTPAKARAERFQQYRYLGAEKDDSDFSDCGRECDAPSARVTPPESILSGEERGRTSAVAVADSGPSPSPGSSTSSLKRKLLAADRRLLGVQARCEADLRAVISGHEDLAERQQGLLEDVHVRLLEAEEAAQFFKKVAAKVRRLID